MTRQCYTLLTGLLLTALLAACGGTAAIHPSDANLKLTAIHGTDPAQLRLEVSGRTSGELRAKFDLSSSGQAFAMLGIPASWSATVIRWEGLGSDPQPDALAVSLPSPEGLELGCVTTPRGKAQTVTAIIELDATGRLAAIAPTGTANVISDLTAIDAGGGQVGLGWTQTNAGDYDFNGEVNAADLVGIARSYLQTYNASDPAAYNLPLFWVDGDRNGEINQADITVIAQHYRSELAGYRVLRNGVTLPGGTAGEPTVLLSAGITRPGMPPRFQLITEGLVTDSWLVTAVDSAGLAGASSTGNTGSLDLVANISITGTDFFDYTGGNPGGFGEGKFSSRIIRPIEDIAGAAPAVPAIVLGSSSRYGNLPRLSRLLLYFSYQPTVDLATGQPRSGSMLRQGSLAPEGAVNTAIPLTLPDLPGTTEVNASIQLLPNPAGGYFVELTAAITAPDGTTTTTVTRLDYANGLLSRDTNNDGLFDDEPDFEDVDRDCVSNLLYEKQLDDDGYGNDNRQDARLVATLDSVDTSTGTLTLNDLTLFEGELEQLPLPFVVRFNERTEFEDGLTPAELLPGGRLELKFYRLSDPTAVLPDVYWAESLGRENDEDYAWLEASDSREAEVRVKWGKPTGYTHFYLKRYSFSDLDQDFTILDWELSFDKLDEPEYRDQTALPDVLYRYVYLGKDESSVFTELGSDLGKALPGD